MFLVLLVFLVLLMLTRLEKSHFIFIRYFIKTQNILLFISHLNIFYITFLWRLRHVSNALDRTQPTICFSFQGCIFCPALKQVGFIIAHCFNAFYCHRCLLFTSRYEICPLLSNPVGMGITVNVTMFYTLYNIDVAHVNGHAIDSMHMLPCLSTDN